MADGYIKIRDLLDFCANQKDHSITPNDIMRMNHVGWISVKDRLPATENFVLFTVGERVIYGSYDGKDWYEYEGCWDTDVIYLGPGERVTHWMPLPEPPKEG